MEKLRSEPIAKREMEEGAFGAEGPACTKALEGGSTGEQEVEPSGVTGRVTGGR